MTDDVSRSDEKRLLIVEDDKAFRSRLKLSMERRGFTVFDAEGLEEAALIAANQRPQYAVLDMKLADGNGLDLVPTLRQIRSDMRIVMLSGYGNIASAVAAVKAGAVDFLAKPADPEEIANTLLNIEGGTPPLPENPMSADRVKWEHIQRVYELCDRNVSETARRLNMHRRTLQRILAKRSPQ
ncbi:ActR/PrrA/RegA family redox response regulator transcription factor [Kordiimonas marina]|uniref:ActR/PrrA/RegA family redox response regulator transcription factor n=1 Tax=Kordiimonas marina TaxID=2872312 RepID=UPI001FF63B9D|nr:ActR/PrrA/RegA family redox response regulator transcription factor [Kordiimonas marina]MCJ9428235.1 ActR/PrrA/RegA family redox response regulator transcription factor [Kordiimonas marina]